MSTQNLKFVHLAAGKAGVTICWVWPQRSR